jgi:hypothetical protein
MEGLLRVRDWDAHYENNRTRSLKRMEWVPIPNKLDGDGYTELMDHPNGAAHLGAWLVIVQVASRGQRRGVLVRDNGQPHTPESLMRISRVPAVTFEEVMPRLLGSIGWLEVIPQVPAVDPQVGAGNPQFPADIERQSRMPLPQSCTPVRQSDYGMEGNGKEGNGTHPCANDAHCNSWEEFQEAYPECKRNVGIERGCRTYIGRIASRTGEHERLMEGLRRHLACDQWQRSLRENGGRFIPSMERFIGDGLYADSPPVFRDDPPVADRVTNAIEQAMQILEGDRS